MGSPTVPAEGIVAAGASLAGAGWQEGSRDRPAAE